MKDNQNKVTELIQGQKKSAVKEAEGFIKTLEQEISNMRTLDADLQRLQLLSHTNTDVQFLEVQWLKMAVKQSVESLSKSSSHIQGVFSLSLYRALCLCPRWLSIKKTFVFLVHPYSSFERDSMAVNELIEKLNTTSKLSLFMISRKG